MKIKSLFVAFALAVTALAANAQTDGFSYQAVVRNSNGELVSGSQVQLRLTLTAADGETVLYQETRKTQTNDYGMLSVIVGTGTATHGTFADVDWTQDGIQMRVEIDTNGGENFTNLGMTQLQKVPYAYFAATSPNSKGEKGDKGDAGVGVANVVNNDGVLTFILTDSTTITTTSLKGDKGDAGPQGLKGDKGDTGPQGLKGDKGDKGDAGTGLTNRGSWASGTQYGIGDYVFAPSKANASVNTMWIAQGSFNSVKQPKEDTGNWVEFAAPAGQDGVGIAEATMTDGVLTITLTNGSQFVSQNLKGERGPQGDKGDAGVGVASVVNNDGILTFTMTDGSTHTTTSVKGEKGDAGTGLTNKGLWTSGTAYKIGDYVFAPSRDNANANSMWIAQGSVTSATEPRNDATNWVEFKAPQGDAGVGVANVVNNDGILTFTMTDGSTITTSSVKGPKGDQGEPGRDGMQVTGAQGQTLVHNGTTWVATDQLELKKLDVKPTDNTDEALFEVKDKDGNVVFSVYPDGVHVYIDESASKAARRSGFVVTGRSAEKDGEEQDYFAINAEGTQVYVDDADSKAARRSGFVVTGRSAEKDGETNNYFAVTDEGTKVFVDTASSKAARRSGFVVTGRTATKDGESTDFLAINNDGTKVFVDDADSKAARRSGFVVTGRTATKEGNQNDYLSISDEGTKVFIDNELDDDSKAARRSGFMVTGRTATKESNTNYLQVATNGTILNFDESSDKAARRSGFVVTGRSAEKDTDDDYLTINADSTRFYINGGNDAKGEFGVASREGSVKDASKGGFAVSGRNSAKDGASSNLFNIDLATDAKTLNGENRIYWYPEKNAFMAGNLMVESANNVGTNSFNAGYQNIASGNYSQALGYKTVASGETSTAIGNEAKATGKSSFAFGKKTEATNENAVAIGNTAKAQKSNSYAFGNNANANGENSYALGASATTSASNAYSFGNSATASGENAVAIGNTAKATKKNSYALGLNSEASGEGSYAFGEGATASGTGSFAMGIAGTDWGGNSHNPPIASGKYSYAIGPGATAKMDNSIAIGFGCTSIKENSLSLGFSSIASGSNAVALGWWSEASGGWSTAMGRCSSALDYYSVALGFHAEATTPSEVVVGTYNDETNAPDGFVDSDSPDSRAFVVGSGWESWFFNQCTVHKRNALVVLRNGDMTVTGNLTYKSASQSSDMRLKKDVQQLNGALDKVLKLRGVSYYWKNAEELAAINGKELFGFDDRKHIGVIAQEVETVVPELVVTDKEGFKAVTYENIAPLLIEAIKEQQAEIEELRSVKAENEAIKKEMAEMKKMLENLMNK